MNEGLNLGKAPIASDQDHEDIINFWSTYDIAMEMLAAKGYRNSERPKPPTVEELSIKDSSEYSALFARYNGWMDFIAPLIAEAESRFAECKTILTDIEARMKLRLRETMQVSGKKMAVEEMDNLINQNVQYRKIRRDQQIYQEQLKVLKADKDVCDDNSKATSRNLEVRRQEIETGGRNVGAGVGRRFPQTNGNRNGI